MLVNIMAKANHDGVKSLSANNNSVLIRMVPSSLSNQAPASALVRNERNHRGLSMPALQQVGMKYTYYHSCRTLHTVRKEKGG